MMLGVGVLVTLDLADDSPMIGLPWIITFGPNTEEDSWEPVVVGPYERAHALALAEEIVADEELMAVVEPLLPFTSTEEIRAAIAGSIAEAEEADSDSDTDFEDESDADDEDLELDEDFADAEDELDDLADDEAGADDEAVGHPTLPVPTPAEVKAGMARNAAKPARTSESVRPGLPAGVRGRPGTAGSADNRTKASRVTLRSAV